MTPSIPAFITNCLNLVSTKSSKEEKRKLRSQSPLLETVLQAFNELLPHHPSSFRPFATQFEEIIIPLIAPTPSNAPVEGSSDVSESGFEPSALSIASARQFYIILTCSAPKNTSGEEWYKKLTTLIAAIQRTTDFVYRAIIEDWESSPRRTSAARPSTYEETVQDIQTSPLSLPPWIGIYAGVERLMGLLHLLQTFICTITYSTVSLPVGAVIHLAERLLSVRLPERSSPHRQIRPNPEITREEREGLFSSLPDVHVAVLDVLSSLMLRIGSAAMSIAQGILEQVVWTYEGSAPDPKMRQGIYRVLIQVVDLVGPSLSKPTISSMSFILQMSCNDILPEETEPPRDTSSTVENSRQQPNSGNSSNNADAFLNSVALPASASGTLSKLESRAEEFLTVVLQKTQPSLLPFAIRAQIDRTAILTKSKQIMIASVLSPPSGGKTGKPLSSILPFLARAYPGAAEIEAILRPRMPLVDTRKNGGLRDRYNDEEEEEALSTDSLQDQNNDGKDRRLFPGGSEDQPISTGDIPRIGYSHPNSNESEQPLGEPLRPWEQHPKSEQAISTVPPTTSRSSNKRSRSPRIENTQSAPNADISNADDETNNSKRLRLDDPSPSPSLRPNIRENSKSPLPVNVPSDPTNELTAKTIAESGTQLYEKSATAAAEKTKIDLNLDPNLDDSDESEFEIPPLTLEMDTDDEDDDDEEKDVDQGDEEEDRGSRW